MRGTCGEPGACLATNVTEQRLTSVSVSIGHRSSGRDGEPPGGIMTILIPEAVLKIGQGWLGWRWGGCERLAGILPHVICARIALVCRYLALHCINASGGRNMTQLHLLRSEGPQGWQVKPWPLGLGKAHLRHLRKCTPSLPAE